jgi:hypothetical protein
VILPECTQYACRRHWLLSGVHQKLLKSHCGCCILVLPVCVNLFYTLYVLNFSTNKSQGPKTLPNLWPCKLSALFSDGGVTLAVGNNRLVLWIFRVFFFFLLVNAFLLFSDVTACLNSGTVFNSVCFSATVFLNMIQLENVTENFSAWKTSWKCLHEGPQNCYNCNC